MSEHYFECNYDGGELRVSDEEGEVIFAINDPDNDQSRQVRLSQEDIIELYFILADVLGRK